MRLLVLAAASAAAWTLTSRVVGHVRTVSCRPQLHRIRAYSHQVRALTEAAQKVIPQLRYSIARERRNKKENQETERETRKVPSVVCAAEVPDDACRSVAKTGNAVMVSYGGVFIRVGDGVTVTVNGKPVPAVLAAATLNSTGTSCTLEAPRYIVKVSWAVWGRRISCRFVR